MASTRASNEWPCHRACKAWKEWQCQALFRVSCLEMVSIKACNVWPYQAVCRLGEFRRQFQKEPAPNSAAKQSKEFNDLAIVLTNIGYRQAVHWCIMNHNAPENSLTVAAPWWGDMPNCGMTCGFGTSTSLFEQGEVTGWPSLCNTYHSIFLSNGPPKATQNAHSCTVITSPNWTSRLGDWVESHTGKTPCPTPLHPYTPTPLHPYTSNHAQLFKMCQHQIVRRSTREILWVAVSEWIWPIFKAMNHVLSALQSAELQELYLMTINIGFQHWTWWRDE